MFLESFKPSLLGLELKVTVSSRNCQGLAVKQRGAHLAGPHSGGHPSPVVGDGGSGSPERADMPVLVEYWWELALKVCGTILTV